jgi:hypothetical protein
LTEQWWLGYLAEVHVMRQVDFDQQFPVAATKLWDAMRDRPDKLPLAVVRTNEWLRRIEAEQSDDGALVWMMVLQVIDLAAAGSLLRIRNYVLTDDPEFLAALLRTVNSLFSDLSEAVRAG